MLNSMIKQAMPFVPGVTPTAMGRTKPTTTPHTPVQSVLPALKKRQATSTLNIKNQQQLSRFPSSLFTGIPGLNIRPVHTNIGEYLRLNTPTPAGVPYRIAQGIRPDNIDDYTNLLNGSGLFSEKLSPVHSSTVKSVSDDISPNDTIYQIDGRDAVNWLWDRRGLQLTDDQWNRAAKARQNVTSQLGNLPQSIYSAWTNNDAVGAYSISFDKDRSKNNQYFNVFNPDYFDKPYNYNTYNGRSVYPNGTVLPPAQRFMNFQETQDHELSHSANQAPTTLKSYDKKWINDGNTAGYKDHMFFRKTNNPKAPYYDDATTSQRVKDYSQLFSGTYLERPSEYIGAMARAKRYGAELGFDTTSTDPAKARTAMAQTLHYLANHQNPQELTYEQQRLNSWLNTAAGNSMKLKQKDNQKDNQNVGDYIKDSQNPFYHDVLDFMTDATIQGLVRNSTTSNNANALQNLNNTYLS